MKWRVKEFGEHAPIYSLKQVLGHLEVKENMFVIQNRPKNTLKLH